MANLELKNKINVPFADKGDKINVPDTSSEGTVNMTDGFGSKYDTPIAEGGEYIYREEMNEILNKVYAAVKELQDLAITAGFPVDMTKALNVLPLANGGTGANNASQARSNLGLGSLATKSTITSADITDGTITTNDIANNAITSAKILDGTIVNAAIANATITGAKIANKAITATQIADNTITAAQLAANSVGASELADNAVDTNAIANLAVTNAKIANSAVNDAKISGVSASKVSGLATVAKTGSYNDLTNKPTIPTNVAPLPVGPSSAGIVLGYWYSLVFYQSSHKLPDGGTWAYIGCLKSNNAFGFIFDTGIKAGGSTINILSNESVPYFMWRIQ